MSKALAYFGLAMGAIFIGFSILIAVSPPDIAVIKQSPNMVAFIVFVYGAFRIYRSYGILKAHRDRLK